MNDRTRLLEEAAVPDAASLRTHAPLGGALAWLGQRHGLAATPGHQRACG